MTLNSDEKRFTESAGNTSEAPHPDSSETVQDHDTQQNEQETVPPHIEDHVETASPTDVPRKRGRFGQRLLAGVTKNWRRSSQLDSPEELPPGEEETKVDNTALAAEAIARFVEHQRWQIAQVEEGIHAVNAGDIATDEEMNELWAKYGLEPDAVEGLAK